MQILKYIALVLINPLVYLFAGMMFLVFTKKSRKVFIIFLTLYFYVFSIPFTAYAIAKLWGIADTYRPEEKYEAAVVLAGVLNVEWHSQNASLFYVPKDYAQTISTTERILAGLYFVKTGHAGQLLLGDWTYRPLNKSYAAINEPEKVKILMASQGIDESKLVLYAKVDRTLDEARGVKTYVRRTQIRKILLITSWLHMRRAAAMFRHLGLKPDIFSTNKPQAGRLSFGHFIPSANGVLDTFDCIYELAGYAFYYAKGDLQY
ncbi:MAG: YdcF family protein [Candidatus Magnetominusculus sp. LBB02]|nr:YdcF family protein [Candidatus Magnetominusculus sp. LBB02]